MKLSPGREWVKYKQKNLMRKKTWRNVCLRCFNTGNRNQARFKNSACFTLLYHASFGRIINISIYSLYGKQNAKKSVTQFLTCHWFPPFHLTLHVRVNFSSSWNVCKFMCGKTTLLWGLVGWRWEKWARQTYAMEKINLNSF